MNTDQAQDAIRKILLSRFAEARARNPAFSTRSMARTLKIAPSALSEILRGKRRISRKMAIRVLEQLGIDPKTYNETIALFVPTKRQTNQRPYPTVTEYSEVSMDRFKAIAEWHHFAILSLSETVDFRSDPTWIAKRLNIAHQTAKAAIKRLTRLGMLKVVNRNLHATGEQFHTTDDKFDHAILRSAHSQNLQLAAQSLGKDKFDERDFTSLTMAIDPAKLPEAKKRIREFRSELCKFLEEGSQKEVFMLAIQLFPLSIKAGES